MALPADVLDPAISLIATYCATKVPAEHDDKLRTEYKVRGNTITIYECRPPWRKDSGPDWTRRRICTFEWNPRTPSGWPSHELVRSRGLPHARIGQRGLRFTRTDLARWVSANSVGR